MGIKLGQLPKNSNRPKAPVGSHLGICVRVYDMGTQKGEWEGKPKLDRKIRLGFELPDERAVFSDELGEQPFLVDTTMNLSMSPKSNFIKILSGWLGEAPDENFDIESLLGKPAMVTIAHKKDGETVYVNITQLSPVPKALLKSIVKPENKPIYWSVEDGKDATYDKFPDFLKKIADSCVEWNTETPDDAAANQKDTEGEGDPTW